MLATEPMPQQPPTILRRPDPKTTVTVNVRESTHSRATRASDLLSELEEQHVSIGDVYDRSVNSQLDILLGQLGIDDFPDKKADPAGFAAVIARLKQQGRNAR